MSNEINLPLLETLEYVTYIDEDGQLPEQFQGKIGVYAIFDQEKLLQFVGYSRDVYLSLKQHLVRQPQTCYWVKVQTIDRPNRTLLESIEQAWITENGSLPLGNGEHKSQWVQPIDVKAKMTPEEQEKYQNPLNDEVTQIKILKNVARRVEAEILAVLEARGCQTQIRFNPKLKEEGLLDLK
ncbi:GIY-YIG nuclease family protein [Calothrix sp. FACHB-1219]|uniref:GIY-YIG nuclease family protein n=1 Tax=unclassified Calothrix TaxID=2619626 RepID=UPI001681D0CD|nr:MULTISPECIES: GIY-YIG nuclease family protein [unclassified Calothrix]MBD2205048.1 GIY-YIG nuclease family protein [Calothrix sp. FACHB-168]MBD2219846.1 GIY-YIG nuclease family protein [Calothrix sp. FACHB-1219]